MKVHLTVGTTGHEKVKSNMILPAPPRLGEQVIFRGTEGTVKSVVHDFDEQVIYIRAW